MMISADGFFSGPNGELDWHNVDDEYNEFAIDMLDSFDALLFGRVTYQFMASYWPSPLGVEDNPVVAQKMNSLPKVVFSRTLKTADWQNSRLVTTDLAEEIARIKQQPGRDVAIFGSGSIVSALTRLGLIDEYRLIVNPVILGVGVPLFRDISEPQNLALTSSRTFRSGNVMLVYEPTTRRPAYSVS
jgi:dihydrofolate reductase